MKHTSDQSVWDAITDTPQETASMKASSKLMVALCEFISAQKFTQKKSAE